MDMGGWHWKRLKCEGFEWGIFEDIYNRDYQEQVSLHMCGFDGLGEVTTSEES